MVTTSTDILTDLTAMSDFHTSNGSTVNLTDEKMEDAEAARLNGVAEAIEEYGLNLDLEEMGDKDKDKDKDKEDSEGRVPVIEELVVVEDANKHKLKTPPTAANTYAAKKTVAQGMMDIALITANANQLRYIVEFGHGATFYISVVLITISLVLQVAVGVSLIFKGRYDLSGEGKAAAANRLNNYVVVGVFIVTIINVFIASFSLSSDKNPALEGRIPAAPPEVSDGV